MPRRRRRTNSLGQAILDPLRTLKLRSVGKPDRRGAEGPGK
jgi:hypothetical protein